METTSQKLYDEFLGHYDLDTRLYNHALEIMDHPFEKTEKVQAIRIGEILVPMTPAVKNSVLFNTQLHLAPINAEKEIKKHIGMYKGCILDAEDVNLFCYTVEEMVLRNLLWPFHLLTTGAELTEKHFFPIAHMMEGIVCDTQDAIYDFFCGVLGSSERIDANTEREIDRKKRQTDAWAANAPIEVRGSIRRNGRYLDVYATARSTVTSGMVNADYQVNSLLANQSANREKASVQKNLLSNLESILLSIIKSYTSKWKECLKGFGTIIGRNVLRDTIITNNALARPDKEENLKKIIDDAEGEIEYAHLTRLIRYYGHDYDAMFGNRVAIRLINSFVKEQKIDVDDFYYDFYAFFYNVEHPLQHEPFFNRFREKNKEFIRRSCEQTKETYPDHYTAEKVNSILSTPYELIEMLPGITEKQKNRLKDDASAIFYDILGDASMSKYYQDGAPRFEF